jgi:hypothetical protein
MVKLTFRVYEIEHNGDETWMSEAIESCGGTVTEVDSSWAEGEGDNESAVFTVEVEDKAAFVKKVRAHGDIIID